jgi:putative tricarboxylic transport membrane protein
MKQSTEERIASIVLIVGSLAYLTGAFFIPMPTLKQQLGPDGFPKAIGLGLLILSSIYAFQQFHGSAKAREKEAEIEKRAAIIGAESKIERKADLKTMGFMLVVMVLYALLFEYLGYALATFLAFMSGVLYLDRRHLTRDAIIAVIASFVLQYIFSSWLRVQLPVGPLSFLGQ